MNERILTLHPATDKSGVNIDKKKYEQVKTAMLVILEKEGGKKFMELATLIKQTLPEFDGSVNWYAETVKLDLEARGVITHERKKRPALIQLTTSDSLGC
ncbi:MAG: hypothetical protein V3U76_02045 [Granulosicoccus sp.]